jgi:hypothetical protein
MTKAGTTTVPVSGSKCNHKCKCKGIKGIKGIKVTQDMQDMQDMQDTTRRSLKPHIRVYASMDIVETAHHAGLRTRQSMRVCSISKATANSRSVVMNLMSLLVKTQNLGSILACECLAFVGWASPARMPNTQPKVACNT